MTSIAPASRSSTLELNTVQSQLTRVTLAVNPIQPQTPLLGKTAFPFKACTEACAPAAAQPRALGPPQSAAVVQTCPGSRRRNRGCSFCAPRRRAPSPPPPPCPPPGPAPSPQPVNHASRGALRRIHTQHNRSVRLWIWLRAPGQLATLHNMHVSASYSPHPTIAEARIRL